MGKKRLGAAAKKLDVGLSRADKPEMIAQQWNALRLIILIVAKNENVCTF